MFDNFLDKVKNQANYISNNIKNQKHKLNNLKNPLKFYKNDYKSVSQGEEMQYMAPRAYTSTEDNSKWPTIINHNDWFPFVPCEEDNTVLDRFVKIITVNDDSYYDRRTDREEIRRRLAMGSEDDYYTGNDRPGRKPSLQSRLQSGMNLQICFMNETASDTDSPNSDTEHPVTKPNTPPSSNKSLKQLNGPANNNKNTQQRPASLNLSPAPPPLLQPINQPMTEADFFARQARLQTEARMALAQAKEMAHMQMEIERQRQKESPITEMIRSSFEKVGIPFPKERRRVSRQILTEMNVAQLQVIVNDLHTQIETLNEQLVRFLMNRDDLHMEQDSMLVDIEDLTRYLGAKEQTVKDQKLNLSQNNNMPPPSPAPATPLVLNNSNNSIKPRLHRLTSLVKK